MLLAIDSGNTNAVFGVYDGDTLRASWRVSTNARRTGDEYAVWLTQLLALAGLARTDIDATIIANVVPEARFNLLSLCRQYLNIEPLVAIERPPSVVGRSTVPAMQSGVFWGYVGLIEGLVRRVRAERGEAMGVIGTGGLAPVFAQATDIIDQVDPDLTIWGLRLIYRHNRNR